MRRLRPAQQEKVRHWIEEIQLQSPLGVRLLNLYRFDWFRKSIRDNTERLDFLEKTRAPAALIEHARSLVQRREDEIRHLPGAWGMELDRRVFDEIGMSPKERLIWIIEADLRLRENRKIQDTLRRIAKCMEKDGWRYEDKPDGDQK